MTDLVSMYKNMWVNSAPTTTPSAPAVTPAAPVSVPLPTPTMPPVPAATPIAPAAPVPVPSGFNLAGKNLMDELRKAQTKPILPKIQEIPPYRPKNPAVPSAPEPDVLVTKGPMYVEDANGARLNDSYSILDDIVSNTAGIAPATAPKPIETAKIPPKSKTDDDIVKTVRFSDDIDYDTMEVDDDDIDYDTMEVEDDDDERELDEDEIEEIVKESSEKLDNTLQLSTDDKNSLEKSKSIAFIEQQLKIDPSLEFYIDESLRKNHKWHSKPYAYIKQLHENITVELHCKMNRLILKKVYFGGISVIELASPSLGIDLEGFEANVAGQPDIDSSLDLVARDIQEKYGNIIDNPYVKLGIFTGIAGLGTYKINEQKKSAKKGLEEVPKELVNDKGGLKFPPRPTEPNLANKSTAPENIKPAPPANPNSQIVIGNSNYNGGNLGLLKGSTPPDQVRKEDNSTSPISAFL